MAETRLDLAAAAKLYGITQSAMRARAKKNPTAHRLERDNAGKIWVWVDPEAVEVKPSKPVVEARNAPAVKPVIDPAIIPVLEERIEGLKALQLRMESEFQDLKADRDAWREQAMRRRPWWRRAG